jgi:hypothetical protein
MEQLKGLGVCLFITMTSLYEINILNQQSEWKRILDSPIPTEIKILRSNEIKFAS